MRTEFIDKIVYSSAFGRAVLYPTATRGYARFLSSGQTSMGAYRAMRKLYGNADARLFDRLVARTVEDGEPTTGYKPDIGLAAGEIDSVVATLRRDGFAILDRLLPEDCCDDLEAAARSAVCTLVGSPSGGVAPRAVFDDRAPRATRYDVDENDIVQCPAAQLVIGDESLLAIAERYFGTAPIQDLVAMWWSTPFGGAASSAAAQEFHFDLDRLMFLKVFVFLTDVDGATGPHIFVRGTHRATATGFRRDRRHPDERVLPAFGDAVTTITGPRGTIFLADTKGLHKGQNLERGHRLVFQTEYATSLFGNSFSTPVVYNPIAELRDASERHPLAFQRFTFDRMKSPPESGDRSLPED